MTNPSPNPLLTALEYETGRRAPDDPPSETWLTYARFLLTVRRRVLQTPPCPLPVLRRVHGLFRERREGPVASLLRLVFDSWRDVAPALRGAGRIRELRYEGADHALDLHIERDASGTARVKLAVEPPRAGLSVSLQGTDAVVESTLDENGFAQVVLKGGSEGAVLVVRDEGAEILRTPPLPETE